MDPLPIDAHLPELCRELARTGVLCLTAEPGAGKTTRVPGAIVEAGLAGEGLVIVLEPRRVAARAAARRVASQRGEAVGRYAGFRVRMQSAHSAATRVLFVTEGVLLRRLENDPALEGVGAVVLDEFHERSLEADLALALVAEIRRSLRPELKILVMSATLDAEPVAAFLDAPMLHVPGRAYPLRIERIERPDRRPLPIRMAEGVRRMLEAGEGDVLAFLPGVGEIMSTLRELEPLARRSDLLLLPLHGSQAAEDQDRVLTPSTRRKVVLATNVAETSLTVPGVRAVVDSGLARVASHDPGFGIDRLEARRISKASATQRAGRAGRTAPGRVLQLWSAAEETLMPEREQPEVRRVDLAAAALCLHSFGERDLAAFAWYEAPDAAALERAESLLRRLGAIEAESGALTETGRQMALIPAHPRIGRMLLEAARLDILEEGALFAALLSERDPARDPRAGLQMPNGPSDLLARRDLLAGGRSRELDPRGARRVEQSAEQLLSVARRSLPRTPAKRARGMDLEQRQLRVVLAGYPDRVARRRRPGAPQARMVGGAGVELAPECVVRDEELFVVLDARVGRRGERSAARVRAASAVRREWLEELEGAEIVEGRGAHFDEQRERVVCTRQLLFEDLPLEESETGSGDRELVKAELLAAARRDPERSLRPGKALRAFVARVESLAQWRPELGLPRAGWSGLVDALDAWCDGCTGFADLRALPLGDVFRAGLSREQLAAVGRLAPESIELPSGSTKRFDYQPGSPPVLAVRLQELFGLAETPTVAGGKVAVVLHLLGPNQRVVQITQDLKSFWNETYPRVRKDLRGRYPKHSWPEDPWKADPTARVRRRGR